VWGPGSRHSDIPREDIKYEIRNMIMKKHLVPYENSVIWPFPVEFLVVTVYFSGEKDLSSTYFAYLCEEFLIHTWKI
jgi:hypothetical protein